MMLMLSLRPERTIDLVTPQIITVEPNVPTRLYVDRFGNHRTRILAPAGPIRFAADYIVADSGMADPGAPGAPQHEVDDRPDELLIFLLGSRYCETDQTNPIAWSLFGAGGLQRARRRVPRLCAPGGTFCRCMNIPARYCTGYLPDIGTPSDLPMDFSAWFEVYLGGAWHAADARHAHPRIGRILMACGRDATDTAITTAFGPTTLERFEVISEQV
jgi:transglutaminase-like putative cysteine protease